MVWSFDRTYGKPVVYSGVPNVHEVRNVIDKILRSRTYTGMLNTRYVVVVAGQCIGTPEYVLKCVRDMKLRIVGEGFQRMRSNATFV